MTFGDNQLFWCPFSKRGRKETAHGFYLVLPLTYLSFYYMSRDLKTDSSLTSYAPSITQEQVRNENIPPRLLNSASAF